MRYRQLSATGDYVFGHGKRDFYVDQPEVVAQAIQTRLALWLGEWFLDTADGMPWNEQVLGKGTERIRDAAVRRRILGTPGVNSIVAYKSTVDPETRKFTIETIVDTIYGQQFITASSPV